MTNLSPTSSSSSTASSSSAPLIVNGLISGINTPQVIQALLAAYQAPITNLQNEQNTLTSQAGNYRTINSDMQALETAAQALGTTSQWNLMTATSTDTSVATASSSSGALAGTVSFSVNQLATGNALLSSGGVSSEAASVTSAASLLVATGGEGIGFSGLSAGSGVSLGSHTIDVTQASQAATVQSASALGATTAITASNNTLQLSLDGASPVTLTIASGSYSPSGLVSAINSAAQSANLGVTASLSSSGQLKLSSNEQGSAATLSVSGGSALTSLGLTTSDSATGTNAVVTVDGVQTVLSSINPGGTASLSVPGGTITATIASSPSASGSLVSSGSADAALVSTGNGSLQDLVQNLNASGLSLSASAVQEASGNYRLQVTAEKTGLSGAVSVDASSLGGGPLGGLSTITAAANAIVNVGGTNGYDLQSSTNTFNNLIAGTAVTVVATGAASVTVSPDATGEANAVAKLVSAANQALSDMASLTSYDPASKVAGPLNGSVLVGELQQSILSSVASAVGSSGLGSASAVGITLSSTGSINFNKSTFESAFSANPAAVASLFSAGGSFSPSSTSYSGQVSFVYANNATAPGTYAVSISHSATQASDLGATLTNGVVTAAEQLTISSNGTKVTYQTNANESLTNIAAGLNGLFATNGLSLSAVVTNNALEVVSNAYGSTASFSVASSAPGPGTTGLGGGVANQATTYTGTDVAGTINGVTATGSGQTLTAPASDPTLAGLALQVTTPNITTSTNLGSFSYVPGLAQQLASIANQASNASSGSITNAINGLTNEASGLNPQIANYTSLEQQQQTLLTNQFANMESTLGLLKNESSQLASQIANLP